jgi:signal transduction histidine kinase
MEELGGLAADLRKSAAALSDMVGNAFDMAHLESGHALLDASSFPLDALLADECRALAPLAEAKSLGLECAVAPGPPLWLHTDRVKLARVIRNLVGNAIKFTDAGGVTLEASRTFEGGLRIRVSDTGIGIDPADLERIFDDFARSDADDGGRAGWGLGLAICRRLLALMGGTVTAERRPEGGSVFTVTLPPSRVIPPST